MTTDELNLILKTPIHRNNIDEAKRVYYSVVNSGLVNEVFLIVSDSLKTKGYWIETVRKKQTHRDYIILKYKKTI